MTSAVALSSSGPEWRAAVKDIDDLVNVHTAGLEGGVGAVSSGALTRSHWVPASRCPKCQGCRVVFSLMERYHHCRRCGGVFCYKCSQYRRRLNNFARPDPNGQLHKVCKQCHDEGPQTIGFSKDWKNTFKFYRAGGSLQQDVTDSAPVMNLCGKLNFAAECDRLKKGYAQMVSSGSLVRQLSEIKSMVGVPEWQKARNFVLNAMAEKCSVCQKSFGITRFKLHCSVCSKALCSSCCTKDLIVYIPDRSESKKAKLAIIKIIGCPEVEPAKCMYLTICRGCKTRVEQEQVAKVKEQLESTNSQEEVRMGMVDKIATINAKLLEVQAKIDKNLPKYQELVDALDLRPDVPKSKSAKSSPSQNNIQVLAKAQGDMSDHFSHFVLVIGDMKTLKPGTRTQAVLVRNVTRAKCQYYQEHMWTFRDLRRRLEELMPTSVLQNIQDIVDQRAINSCYISVKQLAYEGLHLDATYDLGARGEQVVRAVVQVEAAVERDLRAMMARTQEDWHEHQDYVNEFIQVNIKEHRLVRPSRRLAKHLGASHVQPLFLSRSVAILQQLQLELASKTSDSSFTASKSKLSEQEEVIKGIGQEGTEEEGEWVIT